VELTLAVLEEWGIPIPQLLITSVGSQVHYGPHLVEDRGWLRHIRYRWNPQALRRAMEDVSGVKLQAPEGQGELKISYDVDPERLPDLRDIQRHLRRARLQANLVYSHGAYLDVLPIRVSKGMALRHFANKWRIPLDRCLVAGDSGNDEEMLTGNTLAVVVGNHSPELEKLRGEPRVYFAPGHHARGILEGMEYYDFLGKIRWPESEGEAYESSVGRVLADTPGRGLSPAETLREPGQEIPSTL
jgi:sucrose-phosphate synthase